MYIEMDGWRLGIHFSSCHMVPGHTKCGRFHGHVYSVRIRIHGDTQDNGMIVDFHYVKDSIKKAVNKLDHRVIVPLPETTNRMVVEDDGKSVYVKFDEKKYMFPKEDCVMIPVNVPTAEEICKVFIKWIADDLRQFSNIEIIELSIDEGRGQGVWSSLKLK